MDSVESLVPLTMDKLRKHPNHFTVQFKTSTLFSINQSFPSNIIIYSFGVHQHVETEIH